jgi:hypothetical protein
MEMINWDIPSSMNMRIRAPECSMEHRAALGPERAHNGVELCAVRLARGIASGFEH